MKKLSLSILFACSLIMFQCKNHSEEKTQEATVSEQHEEFAEGVHFEKGTWQQALDKAKAEKKLIFLDVYASWCGPCKNLKSTTFVDKRSGDYYNSHFVNFAQDAEVGEGIALAQKYAVEAYPCLMFIDGDGKLVSKLMGYLPAEDFVKLGESVVLQKQ